MILLTPFIFLTRFIEGLRPDIRAVIMVQRPTDLDSACSLALLQEEVTEGELSPPRHSEHRYIKFPAKNVPLIQNSRPSTPVNRATDNRGLEAAKPLSSRGDDKMAALRAYRRARGLCFKCGERWGQEHTCPQTVQMHIIEELLELFSSEEVTGLESAETNSEEMENVCSISIHALTGAPSETSAVIQLHAYIGSHEAVILVDSGSSTSFITTALAEQLSGVQPLPRPCRVKVADGTNHRCATYIPACAWSSQGHCFTTDMKILPLGAFDAILGMDWLEEHNPHIDWIKKSLVINKGSTTMHLQGHSVSTVQCLAISATELGSICRQNSVAHLIHIHSLNDVIEAREITPDKVEKLIAQFTMCLKLPLNCPLVVTVTIVFH